MRVLVCILLLSGVFSSCKDGAKAPTKAVNHEEVRECLDKAIAQIFKYERKDHPEGFGIGGSLAICNTHPFFRICDCAKYKEQYEKKHKISKCITFQSNFKLAKEPDKCLFYYKLCKHSAKHECTDKKQVEQLCELNYVTCWNRLKKDKK